MRREPTGDGPSTRAETLAAGADGRSASARGDDEGRSASTRAARDALRQVREAGREAVREAREAARQNVADIREQVRQAREAEVAKANEERRHRHRPDADPAEGDTRTRIQRIALELFTEHGYEATSLREIAERLGVTKAALYYHFKTKDEIIDSLVNDRAARIQELVAWAQTQPRTLPSRCEILRRYSDLLYEQEHHALVRFFERNQSSMAQHKAGAVMKERLRELQDMLADPTAPLTTRIRASLAIFSLHSTWFSVPDPEITDEQRREASLEVALELLQKS
jgi:AcrR family transcriptional regulator